MIKYLGSKRVLVPTILDAIREVCPLDRPRTVLDLFSGTSRVGHGLKAAGYRVVANDVTTFAATIARCYVQADAGPLERKAVALLDELARLPGRAGYFTRVFCEQSRYVHPRNGERIDAIRDEIERLAPPPELKAVVLTSLIEAADRVDSTVGVQMAYLKQWAARAHNDLELRLPALLPRARSGRGVALQLDAAEAAERTEADLAYIDPPYNQHSYLGNYHVWETLCRWDAPAVYGTACKRIDVRERRSRFNSRSLYEQAFADLVSRVRAPVLVVSFNDEGFLPRDRAEALLARRGNVRVIEREHARYVGAKIGIYNPQGEKVGTVGRLRNREFLFVVTPRR